ncbi:PRC-barrel domain-containing protein [Teichococcus oryzae]|uniref:PRC-barrel domain containing protein n=1 Tax=Teichococcus oryzae TaxID=1608942 RepID=A0A5B2TDB9_9PROT|nr:PRC-barrel domain-containing protein [Pseudoroseomonas oryzae]KAA2212074.1 PRC-barrel domain containing protein [Pseudoroseomonas oryzae]
MMTSNRRMSDIRWLALLALPLVAAAPAPSTEEAPAEAPPPVEAPPASEAPLPPAGREIVPRDTVRRILGADVKGVSGMVVGQIVNVLVDTEGKAVGIVLDYGGFLGVGKRRLGVSWSMLSFNKGSITLGLTRDQLKNFPEHRDGEDAVLATAPAPPG